ncbi:D-malate degradation protein R [Roseibium album]|uniref:D-malate degradation protein R n=2 Tax=Roseibium album TaxID=311410 RepID=A0A0M7AQV6_9HYPH|nr:D-malate degradation protein R [Roseibium album]CTQ75964.1 D-malate degradation protein R [Roseibium album]CTQ77937.1 D-malate degradation protein R [Roseibium album]
MCVFDAKANMDKLSALSGFVQSVNLGSFSAAAKHLGVSQPAISQQIRGLEDQLGTRLLNRTTRQLRLTEAGERYYVYARDILDRLVEADRAVQSDETQMSGPLSIGLPLGFAESVLADFLIRFKKEHPCLLLDVSLSDQFVDIIQERLDVAIRMGEIKDERLIVRRLGVARRCLVASPDYLERNGQPVHPAELKDHDYLLYKNISTGDHVPFISTLGEKLSIKINPTMIVNNSSTLRQAALAGLGITIANRWMIEPYLKTGELKLVLPEWQYPPHPIHAVYPSNRFIPFKVRRFVDRLQDYFKDMGALDGSAGHLYD